MSKLVGETEDRTWDWKFRKMPEYCRPHGRRILIFLNGVGGCKLCIEKRIIRIQAALAEKENNEKHS